MVQRHRKAGNTVWEPENTCGARPVKVTERVIQQGKEILQTAPQQLSTWLQEHPQEKESSLYKNIEKKI